ncbi:MAG: M16 family metallopeptidase [Candidatus Chromulinivorax sp.]
MHTNRVIQTELKNGMTVLVCPKKDASQVSIQLWYKVGSKHEKDGQRGIAHFIEHMIFKGTQTLTESDINLVTSKLSGYCNAFTWYDYTGYMFDIPVANWHQVLPIMADCMQNCRFDQEHLNSEVKAVIQELKMGKDNYVRHLREDMITNIFESHPYHYSTIGFKQDLWSVNRETLIEFYKKYYTPDNAVMVVVGDLSPADVHAKVQQAFDHIPAGNGWNNEQFFHDQDIKAKSLTLYRDVQQSTVVLGFVMPGIIHKNEFELEALTYILANGKGSRLYKLLVNELQLAVSVQAMIYDMFDYAMLFIDCNPKQESDIPAIISAIQNELDALAQHGPTIQEIERAQRFAQIAHEDLLEDTQNQAYTIGKSFVATRDAQYPFMFGNMSAELLQQKVQELVARYCPAVLRHEGRVLAIAQKDLYRLHDLQKASDQEDFEKLASIKRQEEVQQGDYVHSIIVEPKKQIEHPAAKQITLPNGLQVMWLHNDIVQTVECHLELQVKNEYDPENLQGLGYIVSQLLLEGTKNYPDTQFVDIAESYGMEFSVAVGSVSTTMLGVDVEKGLEFLTEMLMHATFTEKSLAKIKEQVRAKLKKYWDNPSSFCLQLAKKAVYQDHPWHKFVLGDFESLEKISLQDCVDYYKNMISPQHARLALVGDLSKVDIQTVLAKTVGSLQGPVIHELAYPVIEQPKAQEIDSYMNRDQVVLAFTGLSISYEHEDYDKILLFDQILTGGVLGSMSSRLFELREQSGLFYSIGGSLLYGAGKQPGMIYIRTMVSQDKVVDAQQAILEVLDTAIDTVSDEELQQAKDALINSFDALYETNDQKASTFLFLMYYGLPFDYFKQRTQRLEKMTIQEVQQAVKKILHAQDLVKIKIGRV